MSDTLNGGTYQNFGDLMVLYNKLVTELKGSSCGLKLERNKYIRLQFIDPATGKRTSKGCGSNSFTADNIINAYQKALKVANALKTFSKVSEFWDWYNSEILGENKITNDLITYREIFQDIENKYFGGKHIHTKRKRSRDLDQPGSISDYASFQNVYGKVFDKFPDWDKYPTWDEIKSVWFTIGANSKLAKKHNLPNGQGTRSFDIAKTAITAICERCPNADELLKKVNKIDTTQTVFSEKQSIALDDFLKWYHQAYSEIESIKRNDWKISRQSWLWVASMCLLYGLRPSEVASAQNLFESVTIDGETVYALTDKENNPNCCIVLGEFTYFGASVKTGYRVILPVPLDHLWDELNIRNPMLPTYKPRKDSKPKTIAGGFDCKFSDQMDSCKCPISQKYAFRHLFNQLCEMCGIPVAIRSRLMGHSESTNQSSYKKRRNFKTELSIINSINDGKNQPLSYELAIQELQRLGVDIESDEIKLVLKVIYRLKD